MHPIHSGVTQSGPGQPEILISNDGPDHVCSWHKDWGNGTEGKGKGISMECTLLKAFGWHWRGRAAGMGDGADRLTDEMWRRE